MEDLQQQLAELMEQYRLKSERLERVTKENGEFDAKLAKLEKELLHRDQSILELTTANSNLRDLVKGKEKLIADMSGSSSGAAGAAAELAMDAAAKDERISDLERQLRALQQQLAELEAANSGTAPAATVTNESQTHLSSFNMVDDATQTDAIPKEKAPAAPAGGGKGGKNTGNMSLPFSGLKRQPGGPKLGPWLKLMYDIFEKKMLADLADETKGSTKDSFPQYIEDYFIQKHGIRKLAKKKLGEFIAACEVFAKEDKRAKLFAILVGLENSQL